jgi:hypothetical protein
MYVLSRVVFDARLACKQTNGALDEVLHTAAVVCMVGVGRVQEVELGISFLLLANLLGKVQTCIRSICAHTNIHTYIQTDRYTYSDEERHGRKSSEYMKIMVSEGKRKTDTDEINVKREITNRS